MSKMRLDVLLTERGLVESRTLAQRLVMAGQVRVDGQVVLKPSAQVTADVVLKIEHGPRYVSRGGEKLEAALVAFELLDLQGKTCVDVGASTGGFTDCLLQHGAAHVIAIDVGYGELHWKLRNDSRVTVMERTNARNVKSFTQKIDLVTVDASFISLRILLPVIKGWFEKGEVIALIKPQFEAGRKDAAKGEGVIRDPAVHRQVLMDVLTTAQLLGYWTHGLIRSPLIGPKGNTEFLVRFGFPGEIQFGVDEIIEEVMQSGQLSSQTP